jgi:ABC-type multidrug transport system ATPase subunit
VTHTHWSAEQSVRLVTAIETIGLSRYFGDVHAVDDLSLHVPRGSVYGFLGPNGAGKTTTIRMLLGLTRPNRGEIRLFGEQVTPANRWACLRRIGAMVETPSQCAHLTGRENLELTRGLLALKRSSIERVLRIVRLERDSNRFLARASIVGRGIDRLRPQ